MLFSTTKESLRNCISVLYPNRFIAGDKGLNNGVILDLNNPFDFQEIIYSVPLSSCNSKVLNVGW